MKKIDLIIFDIDGTLVDARKDITNAVNFTLRKICLSEKSLPQVSSYIGSGVGDLIKKSLGEGNYTFFDEALSIFEKYYREHFADNSIIYPHVREVLEYFKQKRKAILTNRKYEFSDLILKKLGVREYFEEIIGGDDIRCMKPSACPLDTIINKFNVDKKKVIIVGDMDIDVLAGKNAGITTCAVTYGIGRKEDIIKAGPDYMIDDIIKLKGIIN